jgi:glycolate oxidase iron-sulfur subunit
MREMYAGKLDLSEAFVDEMYFCLDCQACQTACPAGVKYGELVEETRGIIASQKLDPPSVRWIRSLVLKRILGSAKRTKFFARLLRTVQRTGLLEALEKSGLLSLLPPALAGKLAMLPEISESFFDETVHEVIPARGLSRGNVAFLPGCMMNVSFSGIHEDAVEVLRGNGYNVHLPKGHACCGSLLAHYGGGEDAKSLARETIDAFERLDSEAIVVDSAGCAAYMKEYGRILQDDAEYSARAARISQKTRDFSEFVHGAQITPPPGEFNKSVTYHEACHLVHTQKVSRQPREIIQSIPGVKFVELPEASWCCGSAGVYNVVRYDDSMKFLERKIANLRSTGAEIVVTGNPGCHVQIQYGLKKWGVPMEVMHPATLLRKAFGM